MFGKPVLKGTFVALGSNQPSVWGDARQTVEEAIRRVADLSGTGVQVSRLYATPAFPAGAGPDYVNAAMMITSALSPEDLLAALHRIEAAAGRLRSTRWGARTLDIDLLAMDDAVLPDHATHARWRDLPPEAQLRETPQQLILPHPRLQDRAFVLVPLCDIGPDWVHPLLGLTVADMCHSLPLAHVAAVVPLGAAKTP